MPNTTLNDELGVNDDVISDVVHTDRTGDLEPIAKSPIPSFNFAFLTRETGEGEIEDYLNHPLNFKKSMGLAQILRGVTGLVGDSLKKAILDIAFGFFRLQREQKANGMANNQGTFYPTGDIKGE